MLRNRCWSDLGEAEEHHVADDFNFVRVIREAGNNTSKEIVQVQLGKTGVELEFGTESKRTPHGSDGITSTYQSIHGFISCFSRLKAVIKFLRPGTHLHRSNQFRVDFCLFVKIWKKLDEMIFNNVRLGTSRRVQGRQSNSANNLEHY